MTIPSLTTIAQKAFVTIKRFPLIFATSIIGTIVSIYFFEKDFDHKLPIYDQLSRFLMMCVLALPLLFSVSLYKLRTKNIGILSYILNISIFGILTLYYFNFDLNVSEIVRFWLFLISGCILISYVPFIQSDNNNGYWQFNRFIIFRLINSFFFSGVLYIGLALAVAAIEKLFLVKWPDKIYLDISICVFGLFNLWYFLSGIPKDFDEIDSKAEYPKILKLLSQYVLLPLSLLYLVILYAYEIKIIAQWQLPIGWVSSLIITYSIIGLTAILAVYPINQTGENKWVRIFTKYFYLLILPLIILFGFAIYVRVTEYGITESRYFLIIFALWLTGISLYNIFSKAKNIKSILVSAMIVMLAVSFGPWGAFSISENSQINRFMNILSKNKVISEKKINQSKTISGKEIESLKSIFYYLKNSHKPDKLINTIKSSSNFNISVSIDSLDENKLLEALMIDSTLRKSKSYAGLGFKSFDLNDYSMSTLNVKAYDYFYNLSFLGHLAKNSFKCAINDTILNFEYNTESSILTISSNKNQSKLIYKIQDAYEHLAKMDKSFIKDDDFKKELSGNNLDILLMFKTINGEKENTKSIKIHSFSANVFIKFK